MIETVNQDREIMALSFIVHGSLFMVHSLLFLFIVHGNANGNLILVNIGSYWQMMTQSCRWKSFQIIGRGCASSNIV